MYVLSAADIRRGTPRAAGRAADRHDGHRLDPIDESRPASATRRRHGGERHEGGAVAQRIGREQQVLHRREDRRPQHAPREWRRGRRLPPPPAPARRRIPSGRNRRPRRTGQRPGAAASADQRPRPTTAGSAPRCDVAARHPVRRRTPTAARSRRSGRGRRRRGSGQRRRRARDPARSGGTPSGAPRRRRRKVPGSSAGRLADTDVSQPPGTRWASGGPQRRRR